MFEAYKLYQLKLRAQYYELTGIELKDDYTVYQLERMIDKYKNVPR